MEIIQIFQIFQGANNANKAYIVTQGPLEETVVDFWRLVWEQQVRVIFMLTDFAEAGIVRKIIKMKRRTLHDSLLNTSRSSKLPLTNELNGINFEN